MTNRKEQVYYVLKESVSPLSANEMSKKIGADRSNISRYLNELYKEGKIERIEGRPVLFQLNKQAEASLTQEQPLVSFSNLVGKEDSLKLPIQQAKAAMLYPPRGLHTILFGASGTGKSLFAECLYEFGLSSKMLTKEAPFVSFNCADYAQTPQLLFSHIFGVKKGAFTGAEADRPGLIEKADGGILFLDEIHRLPPEGQEMLFTFIDKGIYRPLGESENASKASVQIIGATTESSDVLLATFNRRIPMSITLPSLNERSLEERFDIVSLFLTQEATRLNNRIVVEQDVMLSFMLYDAEGNIGQVKRDLKLVCAKAFLHYRTNETDYLTIKTSDLPLTVKKGLLKKKELSDKIDRIFENSHQEFIYNPGGSPQVVWKQDDTQNMEVYGTIEDQVTALSKGELEAINLEELIETNINQYFEVYVNELSRNDVHKELIEPTIWQLTDRLYDLAEKQLNRRFNERTRFTFAMHLQNTTERIKKGKMIVHPALNDIRKKYLQEFQVAIELSNMIEKEFDIDIPFDEIGFITMFLTLDISDDIKKQENKVKVVLLMHGKSTASSMLEAVQELLAIESGVAFNMPISMEVTQMYEQVKNYVTVNKKELSSGLLILTDMGSLNSFSRLLEEETGVLTKSVSMVSTLIVLEAVRLASIGRSLSDIYQNIQVSFESDIQDQFRKKSQRKEAVIVTCFTGQGVSTKLSERVSPILLRENIKVLQLPFYDRQSFNHRVDELLHSYEIKAIVGTVDINYRDIPYFSAYDIFKEEGLNKLHELVSKGVSISVLAKSIEEQLKNVSSPYELLLEAQTITQKIELALACKLEAGVDTGILLHLAFLVNELLTTNQPRDFLELATYQKKYRHEMDIVKMNLLELEKKYGISITQDEVAFLTEMFLKNTQ